MPQLYTHQQVRRSLADVQKQQKMDMARDTTTLLARLGELFHQQTFQTKANLKQRHIINATFECEFYLYAYNEALIRYRSPLDSIKPFTIGTQRHVMAHARIQICRLVTVALATRSVKSSQGPTTEA